MNAFHCTWQSLQLNLSLNDWLGVHFHVLRNQTAWQVEFDCKVINSCVSFENRRFNLRSLLMRTQRAFLVAVVVILARMSAHVPMRGSFGPLIQAVDVLDIVDALTDHFLQFIPIRMLAERAVLPSLPTCHVLLHTRSP